MSTTTTTSQPAASSPLKRLIRRHPLIAFFVIAFAGAWIVTLPLVLAQNGLGLFPYPIPEVGPYPLSYYFAALSSITGPTLASLTVTAINTGKAGARQLLRRYVLWRAGLRWYLLVLVGVPLIQLAFSSVFLGTAPLTTFIQQWPLFFTTYPPDTLIIVAIPTRMIMTWVFNNTKASILIAILLHAALDASNSGSAYITHLLSPSQNGGYGLGAALLFPLIAAVLLLILTKGRLSYKPDRVVQPVEARRPYKRLSSQHPFSIGLH